VSPHRCPCTQSLPPGTAAWNVYRVPCQRATWKCNREGCKPDPPHVKWFHGAEFFLRTNSRSTSQGIPRFSQTWKVHCCIHRGYALLMLSSIYVLIILIAFFRKVFRIKFCMLHALPISPYSMQLSQTHLVGRKNNEPALIQFSCPLVTSCALLSDTPNLRSFRNVRGRVTDPPAPNGRPVAVV
jgi:hypothetical protein